MVITINEKVVAMLTEVIKKSGTSARINVPKKYQNHKVKVIILDEKVKPK